MDPLTLCIVLAGLFVGWNIGANDASNAIGTSVGSGIMNFRQAVVIVVVFAFLGAMVDGYRVMKTVGKGIVPAVECASDDPCRAINEGYYCKLPEVGETGGGVCLSGTTHKEIVYLEQDRRSVLAALAASGSFVIIITLLKLPTSTSQALVGAVAGAGVALNVFGGMTTPIHYEVLKRIVASWVFAPIGAAFVAYLLYYLVVTPISHIQRLLQHEHTIKYLLILSTVFVSYNIGANNVGNAMGPLVGANIIPEVTWDVGYRSEAAGSFALTVNLLPALIGAFLGGVAMGLVALMFGRGVVETMGGGITTLDPQSALAAQIASGVTVYIYTQWGMPISTTQAIVGGVLGVGLTKGVSTVNLQTMRNIIVGWIATPTAGAILAIIYYYLLQFVFPL